jgi:hypothetical protein
MKPMTVRERFHAIMNFKPVDRLPIVEWALWWDKTIDRWKSEGLPADLDAPEGLHNLTNTTVNRYFGLDIYLQDWLPVRMPQFPPPPAHGIGVISSMDDYLRLRPLLYPRDAVNRTRWQQYAAQQKSGDAALWFTVESFFWFPRTLLGIEKHLYAFYDDPELMHQINSDLTDYMIRCIHEICDICTPDFMSFAEDMSYNHGPMISEDLFNEFLLPYYRKVIPHLKEKGIWAFIDSDGDVSTPVTWFENAGIDAILPLERQAGVDVAQLRKDHPKFRMMGAFDKMTMNRGEAVMRKEFERLIPVAAKGGLIIACDHQTPPGVSLEDYRLYLKLFREYAATVGE